MFTNPLVRERHSKRNDPKVLTRQKQQRISGMEGVRPKMLPLNTTRQMLLETVLTTSTSIVQGRLVKLIVTL